MKFKLRGSLRKLVVNTPMFLAYGTYLTVPPIGRSAPDSLALGSVGGMRILRNQGVLFSCAFLDTSLRSVTVRSNFGVRIPLWAGLLGASRVVFDARASLRERAPTAVPISRRPQPLSFTPAKQAEAVATIEGFWLHLNRSIGVGTRQNLFAMYVAKERRVCVSEAPMSLFPCVFRGSSLRYGTTPRGRCGKHTGNYAVERSRYAEFAAESSWISTLPWVLLAGVARVPDCVYWRRAGRAREAGISPITSG